MIGMLALSVTFGATSPKGRGLGSTVKFAVMPKAPPFGGAVMSKAND